MPASGCANCCNKVECSRLVEGAAIGEWKVESGNGAAEQQQLVSVIVGMAQVVTVQSKA